MSLTTVLPIEPVAQDESPVFSCTPALLRHMAHEMRQPLSTIESTAFYLGIILSEADEKARRHVEKLQGLVQQVNAILSDTLRLTEGGQPRIETVDFHEVVSGCLAEQGGGMPVEITGEQEPGGILSNAGERLVRLDPSFGRRMVASVLQFSRNYAADEPASRAPALLNFSNSGPYVRFSLRFAAANVVLANLDALFDPMTPLIPGGGAIALSVVRRLAEAQQGRFEVERESSGCIALHLDLPAIREG